MSQHLNFVVLGADSESLERIDSALASSRRGSLLSSGQSAKQVRSEILRLRPSAAIIVLGESPEEELALLRELTQTHPETMLIGAAFNASPDLILSSLRSGASEFLRLPLIDSEFATILDHAEEYVARQASAPRKRGRVIAVYSNKGGCGTSFIAANLALALPGPTVLVDLNFQTGDLGFFFQIEPKFSIVDLNEHLDRMDEELLAGLLAHYGTHLSLLPAPTDVDAALDIRADHVVSAIDLLRNARDFVVLDLPHTFDEITLAALDQADEILVVTTLDIMTVRNAQRVLSVFDRLDYPREKVRAVVNRWSKSDLDVGQSQIEKLFGKQSVTMIPNDYRAAVTSINLGQPLVGARKANPVGQEIKRLANTLAAGSNLKSIPRPDSVASGTTKRRDASFKLVTANGTSGLEVEAHIESNGDASSASRGKWKSRISSLLRAG